MKKIFQRRLIYYVLISALFFYVFSIRSFAKSTDGLPEDFNKFSFQEQHEWLSKNISETGVIVQSERIDTRNPRVHDENRIYYTTTRSSAVTESDEFLYGFTVKYNWSVDSRNPNSTLAVENVRVVDEIKRISPVGGFRGPYITGGVVSGLGTASYTIKTSFLHTTGVIDLFQHATLLPQGTANIRTVVGTTAR